MFFLRHHRFGSSAAAVAAAVVVIITTTAAELSPPATTTVVIEEVVLEAVSTATVDREEKPERICTRATVVRVSYGVCECVRESKQASKFEIIGDDGDRDPVLVDDIVKYVSYS